MSWQNTAADLLPYYDYTMGVISYILNFLVIYLANTQMHKRTAEYKTIILLNCGVDLIFNTVNIATRTACDVQEGNVFVLSTGPLGQIPQPYAAMITFFWLWTLLLTVVTVPIQFLYRYSQLCLKHQITAKQYALIYGGFIVALALHCAAGVLVFETDPKALKEYEHMLRRNPMFQDHMPVFTLGIKDSPSQALHMLDCIFIVGIAYSIVVYCATKTLRRLKETRKSLSKGTLAAQKQLTIIMFMQATNPLLMLNLPICMACTLTLLNITLSGISFFMAPVVAFIPILNPLCVILVIPSFRRFVLCQTRKGSQIATTSDVWSTKMPTSE